MQIIGGKFKGRKLFSLQGGKTRPTSGKVREAVFNICGGLVPGARVADLFAGTGAMGIEALSRGAKHAVFVEADPGAAGVIKKNLSACGAQDDSVVLCRDLLHGPGILADLNSAFDLVFMDPPYNRGVLLPALENLVKSDTLAPDAVVIIEHSRTEAVPAMPGGLKVYETRKYGKALVSLLSYMVASRNPVQKMPE
ncbi:MAG: 16S rRNA (guanine(966)-N(2))-methyltransferase RsmD [Desulfobacteraceae bacterium]|nr:16S rRNA (guanine(966)-N(2))-methyltransferase RsmD [Desulfobacteraceae bacterium]